mmetsp:Transcript_68118/g.210751  ORF Transcript_68118/g.210751 Transcript_68118/m.210751 type:complete len:244 (+) Transcript_68118:198-929(+)
MKSWRYPLWKRLVDFSDDEILFAGSLVNHWSPTANWSSAAREVQELHRGRRFPPHHEGHWGWTTEDILSNEVMNDATGFGNVDQWMGMYKCVPTCVLIHLGTNDMCQGRSAGQTISGLEAVIGKLVSRFLPEAGNMTFLAAAPIPSCYNTPSCNKSVGGVLSPSRRRSRRTFGSPLAAACTWRRSTWFRASPRTSSCTTAAIRVHGARSSWRGGGSTASCGIAASELRACGALAHPHAVHRGQ